MQYTFKNYYTTVIFLLKFFYKKSPGRNRSRNYNAHKKKFIADRLCLRGFVHRLLLWFCGAAADRLLFQSDK
jgi:hypothetical protein